MASNRGGSILLKTARHPSIRFAKRPIRALQSISSFFSPPSSAQSRNVRPTPGRPPSQPTAEPPIQPTLELVLVDGHDFWRPVLGVPVRFPATTAPALSDPAAPGALSAPSTCQVSAPSPSAPAPTVPRLGPSAPPLGADNLKARRSLFCVQRIDERRRRRALHPDGLRGLLLDGDGRRSPWRVWG